MRDSLVLEEFEGGPVRSVQVEGHQLTECIEGGQNELLQIIINTVIIICTSQSDHNIMFVKNLFVQYS